MVRKRAKIFWNHAKSPITARALLLFLAVVFVAYTIVNHLNERLISQATYRRLDAQMAQQVDLQKETTRIADNVESNAKIIAAQLEVLKQMADTLHSEHETNNRAHSELTTQLKTLRSKPTPKPRRSSRKRTASPPKSKCWRTTTTIENVGEGGARVIRRDFAPVPCEK